MRMPDSAGPDGWADEWTAWVLPVSSELTDSGTSVESVTHTSRPLNRKQDLPELTSASDRDSLRIPHLLCMPLDVSAAARPFRLCSAIDLPRRLLSPSGALIVADSRPPSVYQTASVCLSDDRRTVSAVTQFCGSAHNCDRRTASAHAPPHMPLVPIMPLVRAAHRIGYLSPRRPLTPTASGSSTGPGEPLR